MTLQEAIILAFEYLEITYTPKWTSGRGNKEKLLSAFSQNSIPKHTYLGYAGSDGIRHSFNRAIPDHNKPKGMLWEHWLLSNIGLFECFECLSIKTLDNKCSSNYKCKTCDTKKSLSKKDSIREYVYSILDNSSCMDCGIKNPIVLEFDHRDPSIKLFNMGESYTRSLDSVKEEISKCDIVCANCHRIRTAKVFKHYSYTRSI